MEESLICRICLVKDVRMHCLVNTDLQEIYELLTGKLLETKDRRPVDACYVCCARLRNCLQLRSACLHSEEQFTHLLDNDDYEVIPLQDMRTISLLHLSLDPTDYKQPGGEGNIDDNVLRGDPLALTEDVHVKEEHVEDLDDNSTDQAMCSPSLKQEEMKCEHVSSGDDELDYSIQTIEVQTDSATDNSCLGHDSVESDISKSNHSISSVNVHDLCTKTVKIVLHRLDLNSLHKDQNRKSDSYASFSTNKHDNLDDSSISLNDRKTLHSWESLSALILENELHCEVGDFNSDQVSFNDIPEKEIDSLREDSEKNDETITTNIDKENEALEDKKTLGSNLKDKRIRERDSCCFCETFILNFSRHMVRNHSAEPEVQSALAFPKNSLKRKQIFSTLRKKGNYISNSQTSFKPVKKCRVSDKTDYLPCSKCLGFYSRKQLWRHVKKCGNTASTINAQAHAQNFLVRFVKVDDNLMKNVFPRMKPDKLSLVAKKDKLICMFGAQYLRTHREKHVPVVSRRMRELAKLLVEVIKLNPKISSLEQVLKPQFYDTLVHATKIVARYNETLQKYDAPSYAMNIATSIKQCCSIALLQSSKMEASVQTSVQADLKKLSTLIGENWKFDISSQAADDLNVKKWNQTTIVPLAADLKLFKDYLCIMSKQSSESLAQSEGMNIKAFNNLVESTYCRVLLLNRRRPGELQRLKLNYYNNHGNDGNKYEEFDKILTLTEKILVGKLKRIVIRGKRGRGVPVLFSVEVQEDIKKILSVRHMYIVDDNNLLFVKAGGSTVCGYKIFKKYAKASGAKNYTALTSTRLRKHLATMTQLFSMTESELEQLATFMGHPLSVPNDVYQTAKISKLILLMKDGKADEYQGKALDEIEFNLDEEIIGNEIDNHEIVDFELEKADPSQNISLCTNEPIASISQEVSQKTSTKKKRILVPWTTEQKNVVTKYFKDHIKYKKPPKQAECNELKNKHPTLLHNKDWLKIKVYIQNIYSKNLT